MTDTPTWQSVLNPNYKFHGDIGTFFLVVTQSGYPYFLWNDRVYKVMKSDRTAMVNRSYVDTGLLVGDIK
jgi:hypothetical protein